MGGFFSDLLGRGKGPTSTSSTQTTMPDWLQTPAQDMVKQATQLAGQGYTPYAGQLVAGFSPFQQQGINQQAELAQQGSKTYGLADQQLQSTLAGNFQPAASNPYATQGNPYLSQQIDQAQQDVIRNYNTVAKPQTEAAMVRSGSFGNSGLLEMQQQQQSDLQRNLGSIASGMRFQDHGLQAQLAENQAQRNQNAYESERARQYSAIGATPGFAQARFGDARMLQDAGAQEQAQEQRGLDSAYQQFLRAQQFPYEQQQYLQSVLGPLMKTYAGETKTGEDRDSDQKRRMNQIGSAVELGKMIGGLF